MAVANTGQGSPSVIRYRLSGFGEPATPFDGLDGLDGLGKLDATASRDR